MKLVFRYGFTDVFEKEFCIFSKEFCDVSCHRLFTVFGLRR